MEYRIDIDGTSSGRWMGHYLKEIGCIWLANSPELILERASKEISDFNAWLTRNGEATAASISPSEIHTVFGEKQEICNFGISGAPVGLFESDGVPVTDDDIATAVRRLGYARRELLEMVAELPEPALDWEPPGAKRTVRQNLKHVRNCHGWYLTRILGWERVGQILAEPWPQETFYSLNWVMERAVDTLLSLPLECRQGIFRAEKPEENWTPRKMLRRFVEHEREHVAVVRRTIVAWRAATSGLA